MSRYNPHRDIAPLLEAAEQWRDRCLLGDGSLFVDGDRYWTPAYLDELDRAFIRNVLDGSQTFLEKLELQLADCSAGAVRLMAEMLWVLLLFPNNIKWQTKAGQVKRIWDLAGEPLDASHALLTDAVLCGAGSPGMGYNSHRWREMAYLINLASAFKKLSTEDRRHTLADGWRFAQWLETVPREGYRQFRHLLRYLLFPDLFERISVTHDKHDILKGLAGYSPAKLKQLGDMDNDRALLELRTRLEQDSGGPLDFYEAPWHQQWHPESRVWLLTWNPNYWPWEEFAADREKIICDQSLVLSWKTVSSDIKEGDTVYLMRLGKEPRGVIARGNVVTGPYRDDYGNKVNVGPGDTKQFIDVSFKELRDPAKDDYVGLAKLSEHNPEGQAWTPYASGIEIKPRAAKYLNDCWQALKPVEPEAHTGFNPIQQALAIRPAENIIYYGPPGTGKTFHLLSHHVPHYQDAAGRVTQDGREDAEVTRYVLVTFHPSYSYEDFVEGIRPKTTETGISYEVRDGIFKRLCRQARTRPDKRFALFIDEINRGNLARIFGELITLIDVDKRAWWSEEGRLVEGVEVTLPYSGERFGVPRNVDIYATMNTADRSIALLDAALRRRFRFVELMPKSGAIDGSQGDGYIPDGEGGLISLRELLDAINARLRYLLHRDQTIGHAYLARVQDFDGLRRVLVRDLLPLLGEYFYDDWRQIRRVLADEAVPEEFQIILERRQNPLELFGVAGADLPERHDYQVRPEAEIGAEAVRKIYAPLGDADS